MDLAQTPFLTASPRRFNTVFFALALVLRLAFMVVFLAKGLDIVCGRDLYFNLALSWLGWGPLSVFDATHPPLYTAMIAALLWISGSPNPNSVLVFQCVLGALCVPMTYRLGKHLLDEKTARLAALWVAFDPALIYFTPQLGTETLFITMELAFFVWLLGDLSRPLSARIVGTGIFGGLSMICRSVIGGYPAFLFIFLWRTRGFSRAFIFCALLGAGWFVPPTAWSVRNYFKYGKVVPLATVMGWNLYEGFTTNREEIRRRPYDMGREATSLGLDSAAAGDHFARKATSFMRAHPFESARIIVGKALLFWRPWPYDPHSWWQRSTMGVYFTILFALAIFGARAVYSNPAWSPIWAMFVYLTALHSVFFTSLRYRLPLEPFLCLLASAGVIEIIRRRQKFLAQA